MLRQGRYKAILVDPGVVGRVCDYIHLNPVRAGLADVADLESYAWSSFHWLWHKRRRWQEFDASTCMEAAGSLPDTPRGRSLYRDHLNLLAEDDDTQRKQKFDQISRGWMYGSPDYRKAVLKGLKLPPDQRFEKGEAADLRIQRSERLFELGLAALGKTGADIIGSKKSASWKIALARYLRKLAQAPLPWLSEKLCTGPPNSLSSLISRHRREGKKSFDVHDEIKNS
ncbi:MAG: hypothetical protein MK080_10315 [Opitutales bacterium]|nr:hypothetical protein [Opitutales bacterium]NRA28569.1 hypothetical protein [Opitutales bacterium]